MNKTRKRFGKERMMMFSRQNTRFHRISFLAICIWLLAIPSAVSADSFVVNTTDDADDGVCDASHCSLREAILAANENPGADTITFNISGIAPFTIQVTSPLSTINDGGTTIDGTSQPGYSGAPLIMLESDYPPPHGSEYQGGLTITSSGNIVKGLSIVGFLSSSFNNCGAYAHGGGAIVIRLGTGNLIDSNYLGLTPAGSAYGNAIGVYIHLEAPGQTINNNVVSANRCGIAMKADSQIVQNNLVGTDPSGTSAIGNDYIGIQSERSDLLIGGSGQGNVVSGNGQWGISLASVPLTNSHNIIQGNLIGTDITGTSPIPNGSSGLVYNEGEGATIGGLNPGEGNIVAYNGHYGIDLWGNGQYVKGNEIFNNVRSGVSIRKNDVISQNSIYDNGDLGIDSEWGGEATPLPILHRLTNSGLEGEACVDCLVEIFLAAPDPTGYGEGKEYLGSATTDEQGRFWVHLNQDIDLPLCSQLTATATDNRPKTSAFADNIEVNCIRLPPYFLIPIWSFVVVVFGFLGLFVRQRNPDGSRWIIPGSLGLGAIVGGGLLVMLISMPNVRIGEAAGSVVPYSAGLPSCDDFLGSDGFTPQDGASVNASNDLTLSWTPSGDLPDGQLRWRVELHELSNIASEGETEGTSIAMSELGMSPNPDSTYEWSLLGQRLLQDGETWLPFCSPSASLSFYIQEIPEAPTGATEESTMCEPTLTALMNLTCRSGPLQGYDELGYLLEGETAIPEGQNEDGSWFWILNPDWQGHCWVWSGGVETTCMSDTLELIAYDPLPTETPEPSACNRDLSRSECNMAGGTYRVGDNPYCECP